MSTSFAALPLEAAARPTEQRDKEPKNSKKASKKAPEKSSEKSGKKGATGAAKASGTGGEPAGAGSTSANQVPPPPEEPPAVTGEVIYGDLWSYQTVATVDVERVFEHLPSYKKIQSENLKKTKARYHFLIAQANDELRAAVARAAKAQSIDVVVEKGGADESDARVVDLTDEVIEAIGR